MRGQRDRGGRGVTGDGEAGRVGIDIVHVVNGNKRDKVVTAGRDDWELDRQLLGIRDNVVSDGDGWMRKVVSISISVRGK